MANDIELVSRKFLDRLLDSTGEKYEPLGKFICLDIDEDGGGVTWTAVDNSNGEAITEEFTKRGSATRWLHGYPARNRFGELLNERRREDYE